MSVSFFFALQKALDTICVPQLLYKMIKKKLASQLMQRICNALSNKLFTIAEGRTSYSSI
jgi:hypothetical protein